MYVLVRGAQSQKRVSNTTTQILVFIGPRAWELGTYGFRGGSDGERGISVSSPGAI